MTCKMFKYVRRIIYTPGMTPLPAAVMTLSFFTILVNKTVSTICFSYLPKLVKSFKISEAQTGYYASIIASSLFLGQALFSVMWGYLGDLKGRKLVSLIALMGMTVATLAFGFSTSFTWALVTRCLQGIFMGYVVLCKSILSLALDDSNRSLGFAIYVTGYTLACTLGPGIGGFLAFPAEQYSHVFSGDSFFARFPILLPNLVTVVCNVIIMFLIIIFLPNDRKEKYQNSERFHLLVSSDDDGDTDVNDGDTCVYNGDTSVQNGDTGVGTDIGNGETSLVKDRCTDVASEATILSKQRVTMESQCSAAKLVNRCPEEVIRVFTLFQSRDFNISLLLSPLIALTHTAVEEVFPVFAATTRQYNGLALNPQKLGIILVGSSCGLMMVRITITSKIINCLGARKTHILFSLLVSCTVPLIPTSNLVANKTVMFVYTMFIMMVNQAIFMATFIAKDIVVNTSIARVLCGSGNTIATTARALGTGSAPIIFGSIAEMPFTLVSDQEYAWSLTNVKGISANHAAPGFPFNQYFAFFLIALMCVFTALPATFLSTKSTAPTAIGEEKMDD